LVIADSAEWHVREIEIIPDHGQYCSKTRQKKPACAIQGSAVAQAALHRPPPVRVAFLHDKY
jgi:hypothetical protein